MKKLSIRVRHRLRYPHKVASDLLLWLLATPLAFLLRFDLTVPAEYRGALLAFLAGSAVLKLAALLLFRFNLRSWSKITFRDVETLVAGVLTVTAVEAALVAVLRPVVDVPVSIPLLEAGVALTLLFGVRAVRRAWDERRRRSGVRDATPVLIVGAGEAGSMLAREMLRHPETGLAPVAFVDDDPGKLGMRIGGVEVMGDREGLLRVLDETTAEQVLLAVPSADGSFVRDTVDRVQKAARTLGREIETRVMPGMYELVSGDVAVGRLKEVSVEDLLRRSPVQLDVEAIRAYVQGRRVLVTGAGGSIGGEIARQLARFGPAELIVLGRGENSMYRIDRELARTVPGTPYRSVLASVRDRARMHVVFERYRPEVVFHTAAHKHVPLMEEHPEEAILNNVIGTRTVGELALEHGVERFVNVSSDKAVNPVGVMGASKRLAECLVKDVAGRAGPKQRFVSVRFGNVLGSRGSVVPLFQRQIAEGGPVTITDRRMTRYFMTIPEASQLVLQAGALEENGAVYILDMGEPVRIVDLAEDLIRLSGLEPHVDIEIREVGARPGEKLQEELVANGEVRERAVHDKIFVATGPDLVGERLHALVDDLATAARDGERERLVKTLHASVGRDAAACGDDPDGDAQQGDAGRGDASEGDEPAPPGPNASVPGRA